MRHMIRRSGWYATSRDEERRKRIELNVDQNWPLMVKDAGNGWSSAGAVILNKQLQIIYLGRCTLRASGRVAYQSMAVFCRTQHTTWPKGSRLPSAGAFLC
ncbi:hypothetical protein MAE02_63930 [Microvirga aerophila]|uniref:Uncharacterized protein n=1 Tax=Microvirga aerophila TaxID=670291 RepID=A0A512C3R6_9HYPH|nr:hypothetical protein MAE02_63930 [Microvirga aerophila]